MLASDQSGLAEEKVLVYERDDAKLMTVRINILIRIGNWEELLEHGKGRLMRNEGCDDSCM